MKKNICVFCSSSDAADRVYFDIASETGKAIAENGDVLLFGGANVGLMKQTAISAKEKGGFLIGVIPEKIKENNLTCKITDEIIVTPDMHTRKAELERLADAFWVLPGGFGTLDELSEVLTLKHLGYHDKPVVIINIRGFYDNLLKFYETLYSRKFAKRDYEKYYFVTDNTGDAYDYIKNYKPETRIKKWF